jgi:hypothetical protein
MATTTMKTMNDRDFGMAGGNESRGESRGGFHESLVQGDLGARAMRSARARVSAAQKVHRSISPGWAAGRGAPQLGQTSIQWRAYRRTPRVDRSVPFATSATSPTIAPPARADGPAALDDRVQFIPSPIHVSARKETCPDAVATPPNSTIPVVVAPTSVVAVVPPPSLELVVEPPSVTSVRPPHAVAAGRTRRAHRVRDEASPMYAQLGQGFGGVESDTGLHLIDAVMQRFVEARALVVGLVRIDRLQVDDVAFREIRRRVEHEPPVADMGLERRHRK